MYLLHAFFLFYYNINSFRTSTDTAMLKLLIFECARIKKSTIGEESYDCKAYFDRVD